MNDTQYIDGFIGELLHINEVADNKLIDLNACCGIGTYVLTHTCVDLSAYALTTACSRIGKTGNTILLNSALSGGEQRVNTRLNTFEWQSLSGSRDVKSLHAFIAGARKDLIARGNNPLFLSVGALKWRVAVKEQGKEKLKDVTSPFLIFPVKLVVTSNSAPVAIEFIDDDVYINPCLLAKLEQVYSKDVAERLPPVGGLPVGAPVDLKALGDGSEYFNRVTQYISSCNASGDGGTLFEFDKNLIAVAQYKHDELCTYYDIRRNKDKIYSHPLVEKMFEKSRTERPEAGERVLPDFVLPRDSVQEDIITRAVNGESLIVKGPPGTGKTVTIANMLATLLSRNKKVIFASKKISALTEVYAKLPEKLRKFTMLLDSETEANAAKIRPDEIKQDFKRLLADCSEYRGSATLDADLNQAKAERAAQMRSLSAYAELMFNDKCIAGDSFYSALAAACQRDLPVIKFAGGKEIAGVTREEYNRMLSAVGEAQKAFEVMTEGGMHEAYKCPWFGIDLSCDSEGAVNACVQIAKDFDCVYDGVAAGFKECGINADLFTLAALGGATDCNLDEERLRALIACGECEEIVSALERRLSDCENTAAERVVLSENIEAERLGERVEKLAQLTADKSLKYAELMLISKNAQVFKLADGEYLGDGAIENLVSVTNKIDSAENESRRHLSQSAAVFKSELSEEERQAVLKAGEALSGYFENCPQKPKTFDFKAKKAYAALCGLSYLKTPSFKDITGATAQFCRAEELKSEAEDGIDALSRILCKPLNREQFDCIKLVAEKCTSARVSLRSYVCAVTENIGFIKECYALISDGGNYSLGGLTEGLNAAYKYALLKLELLNSDKILGVSAESGNGAEELAKNIVRAGKFVSACKEQSADGEAVLKAFGFVRGLKAQTARAVTDCINGLNNFGKTYFKNYYSVCGGDCTLGDLKILAGQSGNREALAAAASYTALKNSPQNALDLNAFLYPFEKGEKLPAGATFKDVFAHSFFTLAVRAKDGELGIMRNGLGARAQNNFEKLEEIDKKLCALNCDLIEGKCLARIKPDDDGFIFIQDRNPNENLRLMFKRHAEAILKLKRCFILSPYTASLLFRGEEYGDFDVLIVDEASQLEPALVLPVLFRAKQCIIVGDEWQMPPIKHFETLSPVSGDDTEGYASLESEISVLGLALRNGGFPVCELVCHYRSNTESLIKFSQKLFYPNMRTFPAPVPACAASKNAVGLGFNDVYVPDGIVCAGKNVAEADRVVEELNKHFNNYYDPETHNLSMPVGVVAFGEAQCSLIESKVKADSGLYKKIQSALERFDDLPEKLIFFKTIERVQGQETGHLILSLTHGKRESGLYMHFGQLNQGKLGRCIFNVAVTRAQNMVTVIHSVRAAEITSENISYIREYLQTAERFSQGADGQFVSGTAENGFIGDVAEFIKSSGFAPERVVINYGVTEGSVRIPVAVLDKSRTRALLGVWCEKPVGGGYDFLDYNMRYRSSLKARGWKLHEIYIHDWVDNYQNEKQALERALSEIINQEENN